MTEICAVCQKPLKLVDVQRNDVRGTEADLMHCDDPDCPEFERTRSYHVRPMPPEVAAARKEALLKSIAEHGAAALFG